MNTPLVSVVIPAYNAEKYLVEALESVYAQNYQKLEVIVVDDGSTDCTLEILAGYGDRLKVLKQKNQGSAVARNRGVQKASGEYIAFLDADDVWRPGKIEAQIRVLSDTGKKMACSRFLHWHQSDDGTWKPAQTIFDEQDRLPVEKSFSVGWRYCELLLDCIVWTSTVIIEKQSFLESGGFDPDLRRGQDYDLWLRLSQRHEIAIVERVCALYRINKESITFRPSDRCYEYEILDRALSTWGLQAPDGCEVDKEVMNRRVRDILRGYAYGKRKSGDFSGAINVMRLMIKRHGPTFHDYLIFFIVKARIVLGKLKLNNV